MAQLQQEIASHFPARLGRVTPQAAGAFPLTRRHALQYVQPGLALVGDAAHTIHPLAGQGLILAIVMSMPCWRSGGSARPRRRLGQPAGAEALRARRRADNFIMQSGMDLFYAGFSNDRAGADAA